MYFKLLIIFSVSTLTFAWSPGSKFPCPEDLEIFSPCQCSVVSFDSVRYYSQISCSGVNGKQLKNIFQRAYNRQNVPFEYDILEIKEVPLLNICCEDILEGFSFKTIKIIDAKLCAIHLNAFMSTHDATKELVLVDVQLIPNLVDGQQLFRVVRNFANLKGFYMLTSNLEQVPQDAFQSDINQFGQNLEVIRICNTLISKLYDNTFINLPQLRWIDFGDNQIDHVTSKVFKTNSNINHPLEISLSSNKLSSGQIEKGAFDNITKEVKIYLNSNNLQVLEEDVFDQLLRRPNYEIEVDENPFICDCRHRWLFHRKEENMDRLKGMNCEDNKSIWEKNLPNFCDRSRYVLQTQPNGEVFRKCCQKIKQNREFKNFKHEVVHISQPLVQKTAQQSYTSFPKHEEDQEIVEQAEKRKIHVPSEPLKTQQVWVPSFPLVRYSEQKTFEAENSHQRIQKPISKINENQQTTKQVTTPPRLVEKTHYFQQKVIPREEQQVIVTPPPKTIQHYQNFQQKVVPHEDSKFREEQVIVTSPPKIVQNYQNFQQKSAWPKPFIEPQVIISSTPKPMTHYQQFQQQPAWPSSFNEREVVTPATNINQRYQDFQQKPAWPEAQIDQKVVTLPKNQNYDQKLIWSNNQQFASNEQRAKKDSTWSNSRSNIQSPFQFFQNPSVSSRSFEDHFNDHFDDHFSNYPKSISSFESSHYPSELEDEDESFQS